MSVKAAKSIIYKLESTTQILSSYNSELYRAVWISASYGSDQWHLSGTTTAFGTEADTLLILWKLKAAGPPLDQIDAIMQKSVQQLGNHFTEHGAGFTGRSLPASKSRRSFNPQSRDSAAGSSQSTCCSASAQPLCYKGWSAWAHFSSWLLWWETERKAQSINDNNELHTSTLGIRNMELLNCMVKARKI